MKPANLLLTLLIGMTFSLNSQTDINQVMIVKSYFVEHILHTRIGPSHKPIFQRTISLNGNPESGSQMNHIQLHFLQTPLQIHKTQLLILISKR